MKTKLTNARYQVRKRLLFTIMRTYILFLCTTVFGVTTENSFSQQKIMIDQDQLVTVDQVFKIIKKQTDYRFIYPKILFKNAPKIQLKKGEIKIDELLKQSLSIINFNYKLTKNNTIIIDKMTVINIEDQQQQQREIRGTVAGSGGEPLPGANILEKGTINGTQTDFDGNFSFEVADENAVLIVSYLGFVTQEIPVSSQAEIQVTLQEDTAGLDEVVLTGYGTSLGRDKLTGSIAQIDQGDFEKQPIFKVDEALQGRVAGVEVKQNSGAPGRGFRIRVRGSNSITSGNDPLYVVDGVIGADINTINPSDIQSISVLKDAASTAIYGNQGSNGVVIISTKRGRFGKPKLSFDVFTSSGKVTQKLDLLTGPQLSDLVEEQGGSLSGTSDTDWQDAILRTSFLQNYSVSYSGGSDNINYFASANFVDQEGVLINTGYKRYGMRANLSADLSDKLKVKYNVSGTRETFKNTDLAGAFASLITEVLATSPTNPIDFVGVGEANQRANTVTRLSTTEANRIKNNFLTNLTFDWNFAKNLTLSISGGVNNSDTTLEELIPATGLAPINAISVVRGNQADLSWQNINWLGYANTFGNHNLNVDLFLEQRQRNVEFTNVESTGFSTSSGGSDNLSVAESSIAKAGVLEDRRLVSYFGRTNYSYANKYFLTGSLRVDQTSVFPNNRTGVFSGFGFGWAITEENFMKDQSFFDKLKLRLGWGQTGNQNIPSFSTLSPLNSNTLGFPIDGNNNDLNGFSVGIGAPQRLASPDLKWEINEQFNIGLDIGLFDNRLGIILDYYNKTIKDLLLDVPLARFTGTTFQLQNVGEVENKGFEFGLRTSPIVSKDDGGFNWDLSINVSTNKNEVTELFGDVDVIIFGDRFKTFNSSRAEIGQPIGAFNGRIFEGVDAATGEPIYTENVDGQGGNLTTIGDPNPDFTFGINNTFTLGNLDLNFFINGSQGNDILNFQRALISRGDDWVPYGTGADLLNRWTPTNTNTNVPRNLSTTVTGFSTQYVEDGSFIRLKNLSLGYNLPNDSLEKIGLSVARIYLSGQNLITIADYTGYDPELSAGRGRLDPFAPAAGAADNARGIDWGAYPISRVYTVGLNLTF